MKKNKPFNLLLQIPHSKGFPKMRLNKQHYLGFCGGEEGFVNNLNQLMGNCVNEL